MTVAVRTIFGDSDPLPEKRTKRLRKILKEIVRTAYDSAGFGRFDPKSQMDLHGPVTHSQTARAFVDEVIQMVLFYHRGFRSAYPNSPGMLQVDINYIEQTVFGVVHGNGIDQDFARELAQCTARELTHICIDMDALPDEDEILSDLFGYDLGEGNAAAHG